MFYGKVKTKRISKKVLLKAKKTVLYALLNGYGFEEAASFVKLDGRSTEATRKELELVMNDFINRCRNYGADPYDALNTIF